MGKNNVTFLKHPSVQLSNAYLKMKIFVSCTIFLLIYCTKYMYDNTFCRFIPPSNKVQDLNGSKMKPKFIIKCSCAIIIRVL